jgi:hypothetical protein
MCEFIANPSRSITAAGQARRLNLYQWVTEDLLSGDRLLTHALAQWRDEMVTRLSGRNTVTKLRLPWIFVNGLQLSSQFVLLFEDNTICTIGPKADGRYQPGPVLLFGTDK